MGLTNPPLFWNLLTTLWRCLRTAWMKWTSWRGINCRSLIPLQPN